MNNEFHSIDNCRSCGNETFREIYQVDPIPVAGMYANIDDFTEGINIPITLILCENCNLVQLKETVNPEIYSNYSFAGSTTPTYKNYLSDLAKHLVEQKGTNNKKVLEVGAGDGTFLQHLKSYGHNDVLGVEPSTQLCVFSREKGIPMINNFFNKEFLNQSEIGKYDLVIVRHVLEHIDNLEEMINCLKFVLKPEGLLVVEVPDFDATLKFNLFSNIFHEHLNYFTIESISSLLSRHNFSIDYTERVNIHGGSILLYLKNGSDTSISESHNIDLLKINLFSNNAMKYFNAIKREIEKLIDSNKIVHGFGASHRTFLLMANAKLSSIEVPILYDNNTFLHNKKLLGLNASVYPVDRLNKNEHPDAIVIFATSYENEIIELLRQEYGFNGEIVSLKYEVLLNE
ncbi:methyltransferase domain-containing protein [Paenibacillus sp. CGMCC 1.16610]|uniref:Methyltransferase domain-containing protein n=1 Tax=Paenibacillus anseongense TaxID=2682845 RepID=A0ABW9U6J5_9BACL|nr:MULTISPECIES: class I SAM-dependent methyltransferase [Paenibacillus]MBA2942393.1 methyltransferase domain-containing protein [Paenibacillus sp. CGMCC 1.16610]MVQ34468.1 methyltransferase domain-containing protein [Paenibacillus anseongense]